MLDKSIKLLVMTQRDRHIGDFSDLLMVASFQLLVFFKEYNMISVKCNFYLYKYILLSIVMLIKTIAINNNKIIKFD